MSDSPTEAARHSKTAGRETTHVFRRWVSILVWDERKATMNNESKTDDEIIEQAKGEVDFLNAMNAYRRAKDTGDPEVIARAERDLQAYVRGELVCNESAQHGPLER